MDVPLSPPSMASNTVGSRKEKRLPPITPRRFNRFFTPRTSSSSGSGGVKKGGSKSRQRLRDITRNGVNGSGVVETRPSPLGKKALFEDFDSKSQDQSHEGALQTPQAGAKRKRVEMLSPPESSPMHSSPIKRWRSFNAEVTVFEDVREDEEEVEVEPLSSSSPPALPVRIRRTGWDGVNVRVLSRSFGGASVIGRGWGVDHCMNGHMQHQTANFYSLPEDRLSFEGRNLAFCAASGNHNDLVAIGHESGVVMVFDSRLDVQQGPSMAMKTHNNVIMDMTFSPDDSLLATASGDQLSHIVDVRTNTLKTVLSGHAGSVKQIRFQPGSNNVLATSSRDGSVHLWDLRCRGKDYMVEIPKPEELNQHISVRVPYLGSYNNILNAHGDGSTPVTCLTSDKDAGCSSTPGRRSDVSVTALDFLSRGRGHLIITGSSISTTVRVWDIRSRYSRRGAATPISSTALPDAHSIHRNYGIGSIALNSDESRLYALSRDNTIYAYSTAHLILGHAPELSTSCKSSQRYGSATAKKGLGPIYGFRHQKFHATSFFVKAAIRRAAPDHPELLAVGSSDGCPILVPTDERFFNHPQPLSNSCSSNDDGAGDNATLRTGWARTVLRRTISNSTLAPRADDGMPIHRIGTALVRGHDREVTAVAWTRRGALVSVSDDFTARMWREDEGGEAGRARRLRRCVNEGGAAGWRCGRAEIDGDDDDE